QSVGNFHCKFQEQRGAQRPPADAMLKSSTFKKFHDNEALAVAVNDVVDRADVRMVQSRSSTSFSPETVDSLTIPDKFRRKKLQRHQTAQPGVFRLVDDTHAAAAQLFKNPKMRNGLTDHRGAALAAHLRLCKSPKSNNFCCNVKAR